jgi:Immunity protein 49
MIDRHIKLPQDFIAKNEVQYENSWGDLLEALQNRPAENLGSEFYEALGYFVLTVVGNLEKKRVLRALRIMKGIGVAIFAFAMNPGKTITVDLGDETFEITGEPTTAYVDVDTWLYAYSGAVIARDNAGIKTLCAVPESLHKQANLKPGPFDLAFVRAIKGLYDPDANIGQLLVDAMEASDPDKLDKDRREYATHILYPQLPVYRCILSSDQAEFNEKLEQAVLEHKKFWGHKDRQHNKRGWISLPLTAASATAFDNKGFVMTFETDYITAWLAKGEF